MGAKLRLLIVVSTAVVLVSGCVSSHPTGISSHELSRHLTGVAEHTEVAIAVVEPEHTYFTGYAYSNGNWVELGNRHRVFELGSISKLYTAYLALQLEGAGYLSRDSQIGDFLDPTIDDLSAEVADITLEQLLSHTSGLSFLPTTLTDMPLIDSNPFKNFSRDALLEYLSTAKLSQPGQFNYSNLGYAVAGLMLERASDEGFEALFNTWVLEPYGLEQTTLHREQLAPHLVAGMNVDGSTAVYWDFAAFTAAGGIYASIFDLAAFIQRHLTDNQAAYTQMRQPVVAESGLAWSIQRDGRRQRLEQSGATGGFTTAVLLDSRRQRAVVVLSNIPGVSEQAHQVISLAEYLL